MMGEDTVEVMASRLIGAPPEAVLAAWLDPVTAAKFLFSTENGQIIRCEIDSQVGGEFCIVDRREDEDIEHFGEWVEIAPPDASGCGRLVFDFSVNQSPVSRVAVDVVPKGQGSEVKLRHFMQAKWAAHAERARQGWMAILAGLARVVE